MSDLSFQVRAPLGLILATGERVTVEQWSLDGIEFPGDRDVLPTQAVLSIPFQGVDIQFPVRFLPADDSNTLKFDGLSGRQRETLAVFFRSILSGRMASTEEVITSLDTPVDLVPVEETEEEREVAVAGKSPRLLRAAINVAIYLFIGFVVFWTLGQGIWSALSTVNVQNARIEAALETRFAPQGAFVEEVLVSPGEAITAGQALVRLTTPETESAMADVRGRISALERRLEEALLRAAALEERIVQARAEIFPDDITLLAEFDARLSIAHLPLFEAHAAVLREIELIEEELRRARRERGRIGNAREAMHVIASEDGHMVEVFVLEGQFIPRGDPVVLTEAATARVARGWIDQDMAAALYAGMEVNVAVNVGGTRRVLAGNISALEAGIDPDLSPDFGMLVSVEFADLDADELRARLPHTMPVEVRIMRPWAVRLQTLHQQWLGGGD